MKIKIFNPKEDMHGNQRENIFIVMDEENQYIGSGYVFPKLTPSLTPEHPLNVFIDMHLKPEYLEHTIGEKLFKALYKRTQELMSIPNIQGLLYFGTDNPDHPLLTFYEQHDFNLKLPAVLLQRQIPDDIIINDLHQIVSGDHLDEAFKRMLIEHHNTLFISPLNETTLHEFQHKPHFLNMAVYDQETFIGNMILYTLEEQGKTVGKIENIFVLKPFNKQGLGKELLHLAYDYFQKLGIEEVCLEVWQANKNAYDFYHHLGFKVDRVTEFYVGKYMD